MQPPWLSDQPAAPRAYGGRRRRPYAQPVRTGFPAAPAHLERGAANAASLLQPAQMDQFRRRPPCHARRLSGRRFDRLSRSEEHTSELQSLMRISYAVFCLKKKIKYRQIRANII